MAKSNTQQMHINKKIGTIAAILIVLASLIFFYLNPFFLQTVFRVLILLAGIGIAAAVFLQTDDGARVLSFLQETRIELRKVVWPNRPETLKTTGIIIIATIIVAIFLWLIDTLLIWLMKLLMA